MLLGDGDDHVLPKAAYLVLHRLEDIEVEFLQFHAVLQSCLYDGVGFLTVIGQHLIQILGGQPSRFQTGVDEGRNALGHRIELIQGCLHYIVCLFLELAFELFLTFFPDVLKIPPENTRRDVYVAEEHFCPCHIVDEQLW